jgi:hypothetical protein
MMRFDDEMLRIRRRTAGSNSTPESWVVLRQWGTYDSCSGGYVFDSPSLNPQRHALTDAPPRNAYNKASQDTLTLPARSPRLRHSQCL